MNYSDLYKHLSFMFDWNIFQSILEIREYQEYFCLPKKSVDKCLFLNFIYSSQTIFWNYANLKLYQLQKKKFCQKNFQCIEVIFWQITFQCWKVFLQKVFFSKFIPVQKSISELQGGLSLRVPIGWGLVCLYTGLYIPIE